MKMVRSPRSNFFYISTEAGVFVLHLRGIIPTLTPAAVIDNSIIEMGIQRGFYEVITENEGI